ncbi:MAG: choice-of-anchor tandem repeat GloVer-containing protein [Alphaproteobacteria bacterium]
MFCTIVAVAAAYAAGHAAAVEFHVLHSFCHKAGCPDGAIPEGGVIRDDAGTLYGVVQDGGSSGLGAVFELAAGSGRRAAYERLHDFCKGNCRDGSMPSFPLIRDVAGNLYGTTATGGSKGGGVAFELMPGNDHWTLRVLHAFCAPSSGACKEGSSPSAGLTYQGAAGGLSYDGHSPLYGTTAVGGALNGGTVFQLALQDGEWHAKLLHDFCPPPSCGSGSTPLGGLVLDTGGSIFGVANLGGANDEGAVFELSPMGSRYSYTTIYSFCSQQTCTDGIRPGAGLALDASGNLFGTTTRSGRHDAGTLFELSPAGVNFAFQVLHQFCNEENCADGGAPAASPTLDENGNVFGTTTQFGNAQGAGTLFELSPSKSGWTETVLHDFCAETNCTDGAISMSRLVLNGAGNLFGTTVAGGSANAGVIFELKR